MSVLSTRRTFLFRTFNVSRFRIARRVWRLVDAHYVHTKVADLVERQMRKLRDLRAHLPENITDRIKSVASAQRLQQVTQYFPIVPRVAGRTDSAVQTLQAPFAVDHR